MRKYIATIMMIVILLFSTITASAAADSAVILINPALGSTVYSNNLLISVKITQPRTIKVRVYEEKISGSRSSVNVNSLSSVNYSNLESVPVLTVPSFKTTNNLSFYTKQINDVSPGLYRIRIDTLDSSGDITHTTNSYVIVKSKSAAADAKIFETPQSGTIQFLQNVIKTLFGN